MPETTLVPQCDPLAGYLAQQAEIDQAIHRVLASGRYILGPEVTSFEQAFSRFLGTTNAVGVANGTDALMLALRAVGVGPGDAVITVGNTAVATAAAIRATGAEPAFIDVRETDGLMDIAQTIEYITSISEQRNSCPVGRVRAVIPVHLYGNALNIAPLMDIAKQADITVIEDCAQAHGARVGERRVGSTGHLAAFSFYPTKNLGAIGDGGAVVSNDPELIDRVRLLREYGWSQRYISAIDGTNSRLDEIQAAILNTKLRRLDVDNARRVELAKRYDRGITHPSIRKPGICESGERVFHQYAIRSSQRDALQTWLSSFGIGSLIHYPVPIHRQPAYRNAYCIGGNLPHTDRWCGEVLSLPMFPQLDDIRCDRVIAAVNAWHAAD